MSPQHLRDLLNLDRPLLVFDTETTGPNPSVDRIVEIGFTQIKPDGTFKQWETYVRPGVPIPREASHGNGRNYEGHGITDEIVLGCRLCSRGAHEPDEECRFAPWPRFSDLAANFLIGFSNTDYAGYGIKSFDLPLLVEEFKRCGITWSYDGAKIIDSLRLWQLGSPRSLSDAAQFFLGRTHEGAHRVLQDTATSLDVLVAQLERWPDVLPRTVDALHEKQWPRDPDAIDPDGWLAFRDGVATFVRGKKWNGVPLTKMARRDLHWIATKAEGFPPSVKAICAAAAEGTFPEPPTKESSCSTEPLPTS